MSAFSRSDHWTEYELVSLNGSLRPFADVAARPKTIFVVPYHYGGVMSGFELITITFSFVLGLGVAQILRSVAYVVREKDQFRLHWIPLTTAALVLAFMIQFWFALFIVDSFLDSWNWPVYCILLILAIIIFLSGATALPAPASRRTTDLIEDFNTRGKVSLLFFAAYFVGWDIVAVMFWRPRMELLAAVNIIMATLSVAAYAIQKPRVRALLHGALIALTIYGMIYVWATPSLDW